MFLKKDKYKRVHVEISNICNVQCSFCPIVTKPKEVLSLDKLDHILKQVVPLTEDICLHLLGEPLAHPQFSEVMRLCDEYKASIQITTNGLLTANNQDVLLDSPSLRQINFSLQVFKDNFPDKDPWSYLDAIYSFTEEALRKNPNLYINYRLWDTGTEDNEDYLTSIEDRFNITIKRSLDLKSIKSKNLLGRLYLHFDSRFDWPAPYFPHRSDKGFCYGLNSHFGVHADGSVVPCCLDKDAIINLGNIFEESLSDILNNEKAQAIVNGFNRGELVEDLCQRCTFIKRFDQKAKRISLNN